jgi:hypothetical protein
MTIGLPRRRLRFPARGLASVEARWKANGPQPRLRAKVSGVHRIEIEDQPEYRPSHESGSGKNDPFFDCFLPGNTN